MFGFIKRLFSTETEPIEISRQELPGWFSKQFKERVTALKSEASTTIDQIKLQIEQLKQASETLRTSEGKKDAKVKPKITNVVLSNRESLVKSINNFCHRATIPTKENFEQTLEELKTLQDQINELAKQTNKSYHIAQHLFFNEVEATAKLMKELDRTLGNFKSKLTNARYYDYKDIQSLIKKIGQQQETKKSLEEEREALQKDQKDIEARKHHLQEQEHQTIESHDYKKLLRRQKELKELEQKLTNIKNTIFHMFSQFQRPLRKLHKTSLINPATILAYAEDSVKALKSDPSLIITKILEDLERKIKSGSIEVKNKDKSLAKINELTKERIQEVKNTWLTTEKEIKDFKEKIENNETKNKLKQLKNKIQESDDKLTRINIAIMELDKKINTIFIKPLEEQIIEKINSSLKANVSLC